MEETNRNKVTISDMATKNNLNEEGHNLKIRRRRVNENLDVPENGATSDYEDVPIVQLDDSTKAWYDNDIPRVPDISDLGSPAKQNGVLVTPDKSNATVSSSKNFTHREKMKIGVIRGTINKPNLTYGELKKLGWSSEGFVNDDIRRVLWPKLLRIPKNITVPEDELQDVHTLVPDEVYQQILKDVARSGSHISLDSPEAEMEEFQKKLTQIICWVLHKHPELNYYQGYNDVAATVLIVMGLQSGLQILENISIEFLERFMEKTMEKVNQELFFIFALLDRVHPTLLEHLENVELFPHFALAEYTTWYAHKYAENRKLLHRLFDYFLSCPPLMPLYLSTVIVAHRATEIFNTTPDMGHTHKVLCTLPDDLPFETLLMEAKDLYRRFPPESIANDVTEFDHKRRRKEQEWKVKAEVGCLERERLKKLRVVQSTPRIRYRIGNYKTITVMTILALGLYAFLKTSSGLN